MSCLSFVTALSQSIPLSDTSLPRVCPPKRPIPIRNTPVCSQRQDKKKKHALPEASNSTNSTSGSDIAFVGAERLGISFSCDANGCGQRITKSIRRKSYEQGTVLIRCPACGKYHVIADNTGMYSHLTGGRKNVEEMAKEKGIGFARVNAERFELDNTYHKD